MRGIREDVVVEAINKLYISYRRKMIYQYKSKEGVVGYSTLPRNTETNSRKYYLTDGWLKTHLRGEKTVGVFAGTSLTKFICFDVDTEKTSEIDTRHLVNTIESLNIRRDDIHVSLSGNKGYHVELFFNKLISVDSAEIFYRRVIEKAGFNTSQVELRPLTSMGVKLPLGKHQKTKRRCWYVDNRTFKPIKNYGYITTIVPMDSEEFISEQCDDYRKEFNAKYRVTKNQESGIKEVIGELKLDSVLREGIKTELKKILTNGVLSYPDSRNKYTLFLAMYLRDMGNEPLYVEKTILDIMLRTKEEKEGYISSDKAHIERETAKIVKQTYKKGYTLTERVLNVKIFKEEIEDVLNLKSLPLKKLYLSMLIHQKSIKKETEDDSFYMAYSVMTKMGNTGKESTLKGYIDELSNLGLVEVVSRGVRESEEFRYGKVENYYKPNVYKTKKISNQDGDYIEIREDENSFDIEVNLIRVLNSFYSLKELRGVLTRDQYTKVKLYKQAS